MVTGPADGMKEAPAARHQGFSRAADANAQRGLAKRAVKGALWSALTSSVQKRHEGGQSQMPLSMTPVASYRMLRERRLETSTATRHGDM